MNWKKHIIIFLVVFLLGGLLMRPGGCAPAGVGHPEDAVFVELSVPEAPRVEHQAAVSYTIRAEVADTPEKRQQGLTGRRGLEPGYGMLFVYPEPSEPRMSQAETPFPLSVAFVTEDGEIIGIRDTEPNDSTIFTPPEPVPYVLQVRGGWFADRGLEEGDRLEIGGLPEERPAGPEGEAPEQPLTG